VIELDLQVENLGQLLLDRFWPDAHVQQKVKGFVGLRQVGRQVRLPRRRPGS
jgi:hypothetical protein